MHSVSSTEKAAAGKEGAVRTTALEALGHEVVARGDSYIGDVQAILVLPDGTLLGASDHRRGGTAVGY